MRALISVYEKKGISEFARFLVSQGYQIFSTGGTLKFLDEEGVLVENISKITDLVDGDILKSCKIDIEEMRRQKTINKLENINIEKSEFIEVWQENGFDFITVRYEVSLLDYIVKEESGEHVSGSSSAPIHFIEHWTWARKTGPNRWFLSAIEQG